MGDIGREVEIINFHVWNSQKKFLLENKVTEWGVKTQILLDSPVHKSWTTLVLNWWTGKTLNHFWSNGVHILFLHNKNI